MRIKRFCFGLMVMAMVFGMTATTGCATYMPLSKVPNALVLGEVSASFENNLKSGTNYVGNAGVAIASVGGGLLGVGIGTFSLPLLAAGGIAAGTGLGLTLIGEIIEVPKRKIINEAARESLVATARQNFNEDIDVREIRYKYVRSQGKTHFYDATGVAILIMND